MKTQHCRMVIRVEVEVAVVVEAEVAVVVEVGRWLDLRLIKVSVVPNVQLS